MPMSFSLLIWITGMLIMLLAALSCYWPSSPGLNFAKYSAIYGGLFLTTLTNGHFALFEIGIVVIGGTVAILILRNSISPRLSRS